MDWYKDFPVLMVSGHQGADNSLGRAMGELLAELDKLDMKVLGARTLADGRATYFSRPDIGCVVLDWDLCNQNAAARKEIETLSQQAKERNFALPLFLLTHRLSVEEIPLEVDSLVHGYIWLGEDTPDFIAGRIEQTVARYAERLMPPFFKRLVEYAEQYKYAWHTPGHTGGTAFLKSPVGRVLFNFYGENTLRSDLSISVPELGSLMEHSGVLGVAERNAAEAFGADQTYFVTNGTSTANKIILCARVSPGDVVLVDRNCHKSMMHSLILTGAVPVYLNPTRNYQGIIGPIPASEFSKASVAKRLRENPLTKGVKPGDIVHAVVTNSTYDGLLYHTGQVKDGLRGCTQGLHFDEAWYAYACFHPIYDERYATYDHPGEQGEPVLFASQSTHKLLAAFSQASMVHVKDRHVSDPRKKVDPDRFNESFMMHTSTSPQYSIIGSLDVATRMMQDGRGKVLISDCISEAVAFRKKLYAVERKLARKKDWFFSCWQPTRGKGKKPFAEMKDQELETQAKLWELAPGDKWHGFDGLSKSYAMLDPIKVTIVSPGINQNGTMAKQGIPAALVSKFLEADGVVPEKTNIYSFLMLFSMGVTKGKSGTLLAALFEFKRAHDSNQPLEQVFPDLVRDYPRRYQGMGLKDLAQDMHQHYRDRNMAKIVKEVYDVLPTPAMTPALAYRAVVKGQVDLLPLDQLAGRVTAVMVVPYPPGIPIIMPGERFDKKSQVIIDYLGMMQEFDGVFPGFESENHGVEVRRADGQLSYHIYCVKE
jgi:lysine decarboxylase/arginine decarboxylase